MNKIEQICKLKEQTKRVNFYFLKRRIPIDNGKTTSGWVLKNENGTVLYQDPSFNNTHNYLEKQNA